VRHRFNLNVLNNSPDLQRLTLLRPDGTAYENAPKEGLKDVTAAKLAEEAKERPHDLGKWKRIAGGANGDGIETTFTARCTTLRSRQRATKSKWKLF